MAGLSGLGTLSMSVGIGEKCVGCEACVRGCPIGAERWKKRAMRRIDRGVMRRKPGMRAGLSPAGRRRRNFTDFILPGD